MITGITIGISVASVGGGIFGTSYIIKYYNETRTKLFGKAVVIGASVLPESFPVEGIIFDTLVKATVSNISASPIKASEDANSPGKDSGYKI